MDNVFHFIAKNQSIYPDLYFSVRTNRDYVTISGQGIYTFKIKIQYGDIHVIPTYKGTTQKITVLKVVDLNESSLNNNVITTFKQELTEENKNQALANLGIDPVVWKYMCNPINVASEDTIPNELKIHIGDDVHRLKYPIAAMYTFNGILPIDINDSKLTFKLADDSEQIVYVSEGFWEL